MHLQRPHSRILGLVGRGMLLWFVLSLGVAVASPVVHPQAMELVCSGVGPIKMVVHGEDGMQELGASHMDCPLCALTGAPPLSFTVWAPRMPLPPGRLVQAIPAVRWVAATAAPLPARGPPAFL